MTGEQKTLMQSAMDKAFEDAAKALFNSYVTAVVCYSDLEDARKRMQLGMQDILTARTQMEDLINAS